MRDRQQYVVVANMPAVSAVLHVNPRLPQSERVTIHCENTRTYCEAFAAGMIRGSGHLRYRGCVELPVGNPAKSYTEVELRRVVK